MAIDTMDGVLRKFYAEARSKKGEEYSRSSLLGIRNAVERHLASCGREIKIAKKPCFAKSNKMLECKLKLNRREGKDTVNHKPVIQKDDLEKLQTTPFLSTDDPSGLLRRVWFIVTLYWCRRGCESQRQLRRDSFRFLVDGIGHEYAEMTHNVQTKNHQGGLGEKSSNENLTRLYSTGVVGDSFWSLSKYISKLNPKQTAFFQRPSPKVQATDQVWYDNSPVGVNRLNKMMKEISIGAGLSQIYTNHCVRATAITLWSNAEVPSRHIMAISGHANENSISSYNSRPSTEQLKNCSTIMSNALNGTSTAIVPRSQPATMQASSSTTVLVSPSNSGVMAFPNGFLQSCQISTANFYVLPQNNLNSV